MDIKEIEINMSQDDNITMPIEETQFLKQTNKKTVRIKTLNDTASIPKRGTSCSAGYDLYANITEEIKIEPHETVPIGTGLAMELPEGYFGAIFARSGLAIKRGLGLANSVGVVDEDYRGEFIVALHNFSNETQFVAPGERIAQLILMEYTPMNFELVESLSDTDRGSGGFGSTGTK